MSELSLIQVTIAMHIARHQIKLALKRDGIKLSTIPSKDVSAAAKLFYKANTDWCHNQAKRVEAIYNELPT